jgi:hypothetical protein
LLTGVTPVTIERRKEGFVGDEGEGAGVPFRLVGEGGGKAVAILSRCTRCSRCQMVRDGRKRALLSEVDRWMEREVRG